MTSTRIFSLDTAPMQIAVLSAPDSWYVRDLRRASCGEYQIDALPFSRLHTLLGGTSRIAAGDTTLSQYHAVLIRTMPAGSLEQIVFRMDAVQRLEAIGVPIINPPKAIEVAVDKYLALAKLAAAGIPIPRTHVSQTVDDALAAFHQLGQNVVVKPLFGSEGRGIARIQDEAIADRTYQLLTQLGAIIYQQEFIDHPGWDLRILVIGDEVLAMRRLNARDWRTNVSRGASTEPVEVADELRETALLAAQTVGAKIAGVDVIPTRDGRHFVIEVNAVPGWKAMARTRKVDVARMVLNLVRREVHSGT